MFYTEMDIHPDSLESITTFDADERRRLKRDHIERTRGDRGTRSNNPEATSRDQRIEAYRIYLEDKHKLDREQLRRIIREAMLGTTEEHTLPHVYTARQERENWDWWRLSSENRDLVNEVKPVPDIYPKNRSINLSPLTPSERRLKAQTSKERWYGRSR